MSATADVNATSASSTASSSSSASATGTSNSSSNTAAVLSPVAPPHAPTRPTREKQRLHETFEADRRYVAQMLALDTHARSDRVDAIVALKGSLDASATRLQTQNAATHRRAQELADREARAASALLQQGKNPHEVARARAVRLAADSERRGIEQRIERQQGDILERLEVERVAQRRRERLELDRRAFERKYQAEMGRSAVEARTKAYLLARTGKEQLDPTGKSVRVYPSQETTLPDRSFGLGRNLVHDATQRHAVVDKVHTKRAHHDVVASALLLPREPQTTTSSDDECTSSSRAYNTGTSSNNRDATTPLSAAAAAAFTGPRLPVPGRDLIEINHRLAAVSSTDTLPPIRSSANASALIDSEVPLTTKKGFGKPKRSILEQQMLAAARTRQRIAISDPQHVNKGKTIAGTAFLADPPELWFRDFDVGVPLTLTFTLTNVSSVSNAFKLAAMDATVRELFDVAYDRPGRMSPGMACTLRMTFTATAAADVVTTLRVVAETGAFAIGVRCTCKKAVPVLLQCAIAFDSVVVGEQQTRTLTLENRGALPLHFVVKRADGQAKRGDALDASASGPEVDDVASSRIDDGDGDDEATVSLLDPAATAASVDASASHDDVSCDVGNETPVHWSDEPTNEAAAAAIDGGDSSSTDFVERQVPADTAALRLSTAATADLFSDAEQVVLDHALSFTVYRPDSAATSPLRYTQRGVVAPYASAHIAFTFAPTAPLQRADDVFTVSFAQARSVESPASTVLTTPLASSLITVSTDALCVPIFTTERTLHFGCCVYTKLYRQQLVVRNRGSVALKIELRVPSALADLVTFTPSMGYVQAAATSSNDSLDSDDARAGTLVVQIAFRPQRSMWRRVERKRFGSEPLGFLAVPVTVSVPDQTVPVAIVLAARVTSSALALSTDRLDFGVCALGHSVSASVAVTNTARVPQHVGVIELPPELQIDDDVSDGVGLTLLPRETQTLKVVYTPRTATRLHAKLVARTSLRDEYALLCLGHGVASPLVLSATVVRLGATQRGQRSVVSLRCANASDRVQMFELRVPDAAQSWLRVTPLVSSVAPNASVRIEIEFAPTADIFGAVDIDAVGTDAVGTDAVGIDVAAATNPEVEPDASDASPKPNPLALVDASRTQHVLGLGESLCALGPHSAAVASNTLWRLGLPAEERSVHHTWTVLGFHRDESVSVVNATTSGPLLSLQIETTAVEPRVLATPHRLDFAQVAIGQSLVLTLTLATPAATHSTINDNAVVLTAKSLHVLGGFRIVNSLRPLRRHGGLHVVRIAFTPQRALVYDDELELFASGVGTICVPLRGEGINPSLSIQPRDGWLDFRDALVRSRSARDLVLANASAFPLTFAIVAWPDEAAATNVFSANGLAPFTFVPSAAQIPAHGSLTIKAVFSPALQQPEHYWQQFRVCVPNESEVHVLTLSGRCWESQLYAFAPALLDLTPTRAVVASEPKGGEPALRVLPVIADPFELPPSVNTSSAFGTSALLLAGLRKPQPSLVLTFDGSESESVVRTHELVVGSTLPPSDDEVHVGPATSSKAAASSGASAAAAVGSFELALVESATHPEYTKLFTLEPIKGALTAGQQTHVQVTFSPPPLAVSAFASHNHDEANVELTAQHEELVVTQWIEVHATCTLRGGFVSCHVPPNTSASGPAQPSSGAKASDADAVLRTVQLTLRARLRT